MIKLSIVLPCYNEGASLTELIQSYRDAFKEMDQVEVVFVDNGSSDKTLAILESEKNKTNPFIFKVVQVHSNIGYGNGILQGLKEAQGEFVAWSHSDLQCPAEDVLRVYNEVMKQTDPKNCFGKGYRTNERGRAAILTRMQTFLSFIILGKDLKEVYAQPKLFHRSFLDKFDKPPLGYELDFYAFYKAVRMNMKIVTVNVQFLERKAGQSKWAYSVTGKLKFILKNFLYLLKLRFINH